MKITNFNKRGLVFPAMLILLLTGCDSDTIDKTEKIEKASKKISNTENASNIVTINQGWTRDEELDFYNTSQGSQLMPYAWFLALEQTDNSDLFRDNKNINFFGYIPQAPVSGRNPDGLPIGFVKDDITEDFLASALTTTRLSSSAQWNQMDWLGLTCAACHTSEINYGDKTFRINGGPAQSDFQAFMANLSKALAATTNDDAKLTRFAKKIIPEGGYNDTEKQALKTRLGAFTVWLNGYIDGNYGDFYFA